MSSRTRRESPRKAPKSAKTAISKPLQVGDLAHWKDRQGASGKGKPKKNIARSHSSVAVSPHIREDRGYDLRRKEKEFEKDLRQLPAGSRLSFLKKEYEQATQKWMAVLTDDLHAARERPPTDLKAYCEWMNSLLDCFVAAIKTGDDDNLYRLQMKSSDGVDYLGLISSVGRSRPTKGFANQDSMRVVPDSRKSIRLLDQHFVFSK